MAEDLQKTVKSCHNIAELVIRGFLVFFKEHAELRTANAVFWVYLGQPGNAPFHKRTQRNLYKFGSLYCRMS